MACRICGFSFSRLKGLCLCFLEDLSGCDFLDDLGIELKLGPDDEDDANVLLVGEFRVLAEPPVPET